MISSIKQRIIVIFSLFIIVSITLVLFTGIIFNSMVGSFTIDQSTNALEEQIKSNILITAGNNAEIIEKRLAVAEDYVQTIAKQAELYLSLTGQIDTRESYFDNNFQLANLNSPLIPSDTEYIPSYFGYTSFEYSSFYSPGINNDFTLYSSELQNDINRTAPLDYLFQEIYNAHPEYGWFYVVLQDTKMMRLFPGTIIYESIDRGTDPTTEEWYLEARNGLGDVLISEPYFDDVNGLGLLVSITKAILGPNNLPIGVVGIDITINNVQKSILDINILNDAGYASLITKSEGIIVLHSEGDLNIEEQLFTDVEPIDSNIENIILSSTESGVESFTKINEEYFVAYHNLEKGNLIFLIFLSVKKATESVQILQDRINSTTMNLTIIIIIIAIIFIVISLFIGNFIGMIIIRPILRLTNIMGKLTKETARNDITKEFDDIMSDLDKSIQEEEQNEIGDLTIAFKTMLNAVKKDTEQKIEQQKNFVVDW